MPNLTRAPTEQTTVWLTETEVADMLRVSLSKLRTDRLKSRGISYVKFGRLVRYAVDDVREFMDANKINTSKL